MNANQHRWCCREVIALILVLLITGSLACRLVSEVSTPDEPHLGPTALAPTVPVIVPTLTPADEGVPPETSPPSTAGAHGFSKWGLWVGGPHLRGANIYQRRVYPELDGPTFMGPGPVGPPFVQEDFDHLAGMGANYVNISHPGLFGETPPYKLDRDIQENLDRLLEMIAHADMFAVISFRTGPGRSEFTFFWGEDDDWFDASYYDDHVWEDQAAQRAWGDMWRYTAERYREHPIVVGYDLMVEPNSNEVWFNEWDAETFYDEYGGTTYDWNPLARRISAAIRDVDPATPILVGGNAYSRVDWLPYLEPTGDAHTVYLVHQYAPSKYTHQEPWGAKSHYPGEVDVDWDGADEGFDRAWLEKLLSIVETYAASRDVPLAANEFGLARWVPDGDAFMDDQMAIFESLGMNYALWEWSPSWAECAENDAFNFRHGPDPENHQDVPGNELAEVIEKYWRQNVRRPSNTPFQD